MSPRRRTRVLTTLALLLPLPVAAQLTDASAGQRLANVEQALAASAILAGRPGPTSVNWIEEGEAFSYSTRNPGTGQVEVRYYQPATLEDQLLFDRRDLTLPGTANPVEYTDFQFGRDSRFILFRANFRPIYRRSGIADFYLYDRETGELELAVDDARTAELSPDGRLLGFERGGDMYAVDLASGDERRLTTSGSDTIFNGVFDWVYEEEFGQAQAWRWSPDSRRIAFWQTEEAGVPLVRLTDYEGQHPEWVEIPYPKVGDHNPAVRIGVVGVEEQRAPAQVRWLDTELDGEHYIPRIHWTSDPDLLAVTTLNRAQNHLQVFLFDVRTGERTKVLDETSDAWIDVYDFFAGIDDFLYFPEGVREFFWVSDRDGWQHLYRYDYAGNLLGQVTEGLWSVTRVERIDPASRTVYYTSTEASPLERHLYAVRFDGTGKRRLTGARGQHTVDFSPNGRWYIDRWSNAETPRQVELWSTDGERVAVLEDNARVREWVAENAYSPLELFRFTTSEGVELDGSMIRPPDFDPSRRYPVLVSIYGGPGSQQVYDAFATNGWHQYLAQRGYVVVGLNNRGSGNYGRDFMEAVYGRLGVLESRDFAELGRWLAAQPWVNGERMAIQGTSYGGYAAVMTMLAHPGVYALGIANSPVTDWRLYDTIYTERYMGLLSENEEGYLLSSTIPKAGRLQGQLLLVHSAMDENVHPQHTMQLLTALADAGKDAALRFYPPGAHGAAYNSASYLTMTKSYTNALCRALEEDCDPVAINE